MNDLEFETVRGFEPAGNSAFIPLDATVHAPVSYPFPSSSARTEQLQELSMLLKPQENPDVVPWRKSENNQRQFSRCPIPEDRTPAVLSMNGRRFDCRLVELSIGGFGVLVPGQLQLRSGTVGSLRAPGLNYIVSVTRIEPRSDGLFIGLKQIEEVLDSEQQLPGEPSPIVAYLVAGVAGAFIAAAAYFFMYGR